VADAAIGLANDTEFGLGANAWSSDQAEQSWLIRDLAAGMVFINGNVTSERAVSSEGARKRAIARVVQEVGGYLGNTPAVARASYIDPRVIDLYQDGRTIASALGELGKDCDFGDLATRGRAEQAVLNLLAAA
jgi:DNA topoisomerase IB